MHGRIVTVNSAYTQTKIWELLCDAKNLFETVIISPGTCRVAHTYSTAGKRNYVRMYMCVCVRVCVLLGMQKENLFRSCFCFNRISEIGTFSSFIVYPSYASYLQCALCNINVARCSAGTFPTQGASTYLHLRLGSFGFALRITAHALVLLCWAHYLRYE